MFIMTSSPVAVMLIAVIAFIGLRGIFALPLAWYANRKGYDWRGFMISAAFFSWVTTLVVLIVLPKIVSNYKKWSLLLRSKTI